MSIPTATLIFTVPHGHKLDAISCNPKISFCVVGPSHVVPEEYASSFSGVIALGAFRVLNDKQKILAPLERLAIKYYPPDPFQHRNQETKNAISQLCMLEMTVVHLPEKLHVDGFRGSLFILPLIMIIQKADSSSVSS